MLMQNLQIYAKNSQCEIMFDFYFAAPVVVTTTTIPVAQPAGYPAQNTIIQGYPMPQPQPG